MIQVRYRKGPLSQKSAGHMQNRKTKTNTNPIILTLTDTGGAVLTLMLGNRSFMHYMASDFCDSGPLR